MVEHVQISKKLSCLYAGVAKLVRHQTDNLEIAGPSPALSTIFMRPPRFSDRLTGFPQYPGLAQFDRARALGARGREFESHISDQNVIL